MSIRKKIAAAALTTGVLLGGVAVATPASAAVAPDGDYCGPTTQVIPGGSVYARACISITSNNYEAYAYVTSQGDNTFTGSDTFINSGGTYYAKGDCNLPSHATFSNMPCYGLNVSYSINGYVQGQVELWVNGGYYKAFSPTEYVG